MLISTIDVLVFAISLAYDGINDSDLLAPEPKALYDFGEKVSFGL